MKMIDEKSDFKRDAVEYPVRHASDIIGQWGPLQRNAVYFYIGIYVVAAFNNIGISFYAPKIDFWCKRPAGYENATLQECNSYEDLSKPCTEWEYDKSFYWSTMTEEFNLVCDRTWLRSMAASIFQIGYAVACLITGYAADKYGRLRVFKWCTYLELVASLFQSLSTSIEMFLVARFLLAFGAYGRFAVGRTLLFEVSGPLTRAKISIGVEVGWFAGYLLLPWVNYLVPHFRYVQLGVTAYELVFILWLRYVPESPRWQLTHDKFSDVEKSLTKGAQMKGKLSPAEIAERIASLKQFVQSEDEKLKVEAKKTLIDLFKVPKLLKFCLISYVTNFAAGFVFYGFTYNAGSIGGSMHLNVFLQAVSGGVSQFMMYYIVERYPRKKLAGFSAAMAVITLLAIIPFTFVSYGTPYTMVLSTLGMFWFSAYILPVGLIVSETFPTTLRQMAVSSCSLVSRFGSMAAPFLSMLVEVTHVSVMMGLFALLCAIMGLLVLPLPETRGLEIPDTLEEATTTINRKPKKPDSV